jgi:transcriptional regulator with XRE-family HTH domain
VKDINKNIGLNIRQLRDENNMTLDELSDKIGLSRQMIWNYEHHIHEPTGKNLNKISKFFKVSTDYLKGLDSEKVLVNDRKEEDTTNNYWKQKYERELADNEVLSQQSIMLNIRIHEQSLLIEKLEKEIKELKSSPKEAKK